MDVDALRQGWVNLILTSTFCLTVCFLGIAAGRWLVGLKGGT